MRHCDECCFELGEFNRACCAVHTGSAAGHDDEGVVGRGVAINGDAVERLIGDAAHHGFQIGLWHARIGGDEAKHGRHIRLDHARAFGDAGDGDGFTVDLNLFAHGFGQRVGGHDRLCGVVPVVFGQIRYRCGQSADQFVHRQVFENHAGGERQYLAVGDIQQFSQFATGSLRIAHAVLARACIGATGVDDQRANAVINR